MSLQLSVPSLISLNGGRQDRSVADAGSLAAVPIGIDPDDRLAVIDRFGEIGRRSRRSR